MKPQLTTQNFVVDETFSDETSTEKGEFCCQWNLYYNRRILMLMKPLLTKENFVVHETSTDNGEFCWEHGLLDIIQNMTYDMIMAWNNILVIKTCTDKGEFFCQWNLYRQRIILLSMKPLLTKEIIVVNETSTDKGEFCCRWKLYTKIV